MNNNNCVNEISIETTTLAEDIVADILNDLFPGGVCMEENEDTCILKAYTSKSEKEIKKDLDSSLDLLRKNSEFNVGSLLYKINTVNPDLWFDEWKKGYDIIKEGNIVIVPAWMEYDKKDNEKVIKIDPNKSFGSGQHESTKMCLSLIQGLDLKDKKIVDIGTGSGILALASAACGAKDIEAYDIDDTAINAAKENVKINGFSKYITVDNSNILDSVTGKFDIVLANITSEVLKALAKDLKRYLNKNGIIIISGILTSLESEVIDVYKNLGFKIIQRLNLGEWVAFELSLDYGN